MNRRLLPFTVSLVLLTASLSSVPVAVGTCEDCASLCSSIPMATEQCLEAYCSECAGVR